MNNFKDVAISKMAKALKILHSIVRRGPGNELIVRPENPETIEYKPLIL
jgi:hypothetical protein